MSADAGHEQDVVQEVYQRDLAAPERVGAAQPKSSFATAAEVASAVGNRNFTQMIQRMGDGGGIMPGGLVHPDIQQAIDMAAGGGRPLAGQVRQTLESGFGTSLSDVRIHTGPEAQALNRAVSARAFTVGSDIFFGTGEFQPDSPHGQELLAHEAAHTIQQRGAVKAGPLQVSMPGDALEREADSLAGDALH